MHLHPNYLDGGQDLWLDKVTTLDDLGSGVRLQSILSVGFCERSGKIHIHRLAMGFQELRHVKLGSFEDLCLSDVHVVKWVDALYSLISKASDSATS